MKKNVVQLYWHQYFYKKTEMQELCLRNSLQRFEKVLNIHLLVLFFASVNYKFFSNEFLILYDSKVDIKGKN